MKTKTLMTMAVAGTFGLSATAFADIGHEVMTPFSVNESAGIFEHEQGFGSSNDLAMGSGGTVEVITPLAVNETAGDDLAIGSTRDEAGGSLSGSYSESSGLETESSASLETDDSLAFGDDGSYSDFYVVSWTPVMVESWDLYLIPIESDELAAADDSEIGMPTQELALVSEDEADADLTLAEIPSDEGSFHVSAVPEDTSNEATG
jgi:hypothetical protein